MKIILSNKNYEEKETCIKLSDELNVGKFLFSNDDKHTLVQIGEMTGNENDDNEEETFRGAIYNALQYCIDNKVENAAIDLSALTSDVSYIVNNVIEKIGEFSLENTESDLVLSVYVPKISKSMLDAFKKNVSDANIVWQAFGDCGDYLKDRFERFNKDLKHEPLFRDYLIDLINAKEIKKYSSVYRAAGISRSTFSKITNYISPHQPSKETVAALTIGLKLNMEEAQKFYNVAGYYLGQTDFVDRVIRFFIRERIYDIDKVNCCLYEYKHAPLGEKPRDEKYEIQ